MSALSPSGAFEGGGFIPDDAQSNSTRLPLSERALSVELPEQRHKVLRAGSKKEWDTLRWIEAHMLSLNRKHAKRFEPGRQWDVAELNARGQDALSTSASPQTADDDLGYADVAEFVADVDQVTNVLWVCGTPSIQIPQTIALISFVEAGLPAYPFQPEPTFSLLAKLDVVLASLLTGRNVLNNAPLSGCLPEPPQEEDDPLEEELMFSYAKKPEPKSKVSATERVRIKSIAESTRMIVLDVQAGRRREGLAESGMPPGLSESSTESGNVSAVETDRDTFDVTEDDDDYEMDEASEQPASRRWRLEAAKVYEMTMHILGDDLGSDAIVIE